MPMKPSISRGLGALTPEVWSRLTSAIAFVEEYRESIAEMAAQQGTAFAPSARVFWAKITGSKEMSGCGTNPNCYRWRYGWKKVKISVQESSGATVVVPTDYAVGGEGSLVGSKDDEANYGTSNPTLSTFALNLCEIGNTTTLRSGYATDGTSGYLKDGSAQQVNGWYVQQVPTDTIVLMSAVRTFNGRAQYVFSMQNPVNGVCSNPLWTPGGGGVEDQGEIPL